MEGNSFTVIEDVRVIDILILAFRVLLLDLKEDFVVVDKDAIDLLKIV